MAREMIVAKFGGTSMANAAAIDRSGSLAVSKMANIIVVSATSGSTNDILDMIATSTYESWQQCSLKIEAFTAKHRKIADDLNADEATFKDLELLYKEMSGPLKGVHLLRECSAKTRDAILSTGERISSLLLSFSLQQKYPEKKIILFDIRKILLTNDHFGGASPDIDSLYQRSCAYLSPLLERGTIVVTQGFIGATEEGETTTLGRGGSDYSAALIAESVRAQTLQIWTDVAGIATTDPRICPKASPLVEITFKEAAELATFGAKILHPTTLTPAMRQNIAVFVGSSFEPEARGTWIKKADNSPPLVRALALKKDQSLLTLSTPKMSHAPGFLYQVFKIFNDHRVSIDSITTSEISVALTVDDATLLNKKLFKELEIHAQIKIEEGLSLVSLIGNKINFTIGLAQKIFTALGDINARMICQGASKHNFCFLVHEDFGPKALQRLHREFIEKNI